jgi:predicted secreted acid phosphatase
LINVAGDNYNIRSTTDSIKNNWGNRFIVLPDTTYGEWENALHYNNKALTSNEKLNLLGSLLKDESAIKQ